MEYVILFFVAAIVSVIVSICVIALVSVNDEQHTDDERAESIRGALEEQSAPWRQHVRNIK